MVLIFIIYISLLLTSIFLISRYITRKREPLTLQSSRWDQLVYGVVYGISGIGIMYVHRALEGNDYADIRQILLLLPFFYGGWVPALYSGMVMIAYRYLELGTGTAILLFILSTVATLGIAQLAVLLPISRSKQWYMMTVLTIGEIYVFLFMRQSLSDWFDPVLFQFSFAFFIGGLFSYQFTESLRRSQELWISLVESQEKLKQSDALYRLISENSSDLISVLNIYAQPIYLSPSHEKSLGMDLEEFRGKNLGEFIHPEDRRIVFLGWHHSIRQRKPSQSEYRYRTVNGQWVWLEAHYVPVLNDKGMVDQIVAVSRDVTERKRTETLYYEAEKLSVVGQLAAGIAHEIRNPLTTLKGFIQFMQEDSSNTSQHSILKIMYDELNQIDSITNEILYLAKPQAEELRPIEVPMLFESVKNIFHNQITLNNLELKIQCEEPLPTLNCSENRIKQVVINLLKNSIEAMPAGGEILMTARQNGQDLLLTVKDEGIGIPAERMEKLGEPFYTLKDKGTGLGLTVCKKIIQEHRGTLTFYSKVGVGTTVEIRFNLQDNPVNRSA